MADPTWPSTIGIDGGVTQEGQGLSGLEALKGRASQHQSHGGLEHTRIIELQADLATVEVDGIAAEGGAWTQGGGIGGIQRQASAAAADFGSCTDDHIRLFGRCDVVAYAIDAPGSLLTRSRVPSPSETGMEPFVPEAVKIPPLLKVIVWPAVSWVGVLAAKLTVVPLVLVIVAATLEVILSAPLPEGEADGSATAHKGQGAARGQWGGIVQVKGVRSPAQRAGLLNFRAGRQDQALVGRQNDFRPA